MSERGLVDVQQASPRRFRDISAETVSRTFEPDLLNRTETLRTALNELEPPERRTEQRGVWTVDGRTTLVSALVNGADAAPSDSRSETAIWGEGESNSPVVVLRAMFAWRFDTVAQD